MHLCTKTSKCEVDCAELAPNSVKGVHTALKMWEGRNNLKSSILVANHQQQRSTQHVLFQGGLRVEAQHQSSEIAAVILQFVFAIHFDEGQNLHARGSESVVRRAAARGMTAKQELACTVGTMRGTPFKRTHRHRKIVPTKNPKGECKESAGGGASTHPIWKLETPPRAAPNWSNMRSKTFCSHASNHRPCTDSGLGFEDHRAQASASVNCQQGGQSRGPKKLEMACGTMRGTGHSHSRVGREQKTEPNARIERMGALGDRSNPKANCSRRTEDPWSTNMPATSGPPCMYSFPSGREG